MHKKVQTENRSLKSRKSADKMSKNPGGRSNLFERLSSTSSSSSDSALDYESDKFDALKALYSAKVPLKAKEFTKYDNLAMFEAALKKVGPTDVGVTRPKTAGKSKPSTSTSTGDLSERRFLPHQRPIYTGGVMKARHTRNIFTKIKGFTGPLGALREFMEGKRRVVVYTRKEHGVRGTTTGIIVCFDKHWNLLLSDATEIWKRRKYKFSENNAICGTPTDCAKRLKRLGLSIPETEVRSLNRKYVECTRKVNQVMIRGEQVVLVAAAAVPPEEEKS